MAKKSHIWIRCKTCQTCRKFEVSLNGPFIFPFWNRPFLVKNWRFLSGNLWIMNDFRTKMVSMTKNPIHMKPLILNHADTPSLIVLPMIKGSGPHVPSYVPYGPWWTVHYPGLACWSVRWALKRFHHVPRRWRKVLDPYFETRWTSFRCYRCFQPIFPILQIWSLLRTKLLATKSRSRCPRRRFRKRKWWQG